MMSHDRKELVRNELMCFLQQKSNVLLFDDLVTIVTDYYTSDEVKGAVSSVHEYVDTRIPSYKGADKDRKTVSDLLKIVLNPEITLPSYVAVDIARLPPVDVEHLDLSALLRELTLLRSEVRCLGTLRVELDEVKSKLKEVQSHQTAATFANTRVDPAGNDIDDNGFTVVDRHRQKKKPAMSYAAKAHDLQRAGMEPARKKEPVFGTSVTNRTVKSVDTVRTVDIFVSRLHPLTAEGELIDCVHSVKGDMSVTNVQCKKLQSKYEELYSSFYVEVTVSSVQFKAALDLFASAEAWPMGVFVKRYFKPRHGSSNAS